MDVVVAVEFRLDVGEGPQDLGAVVGTGMGNSFRYVHERIYPNNSVRCIVDVVAGTGAVEGQIEEPRELPEVDLGRTQEHLVPFDIVVVVVVVEPFGEQLVQVAVVSLGQIPAKEHLVLFDIVVVVAVQPFEVQLGQAAEEH